MTAQRVYGIAATPEYRSWRGMKRRCLDSRATRFSYYGGRGITICERWRTSFPCFLADMGPKPTSKHSLDRVNNDGHYCPENCRWATQSEQRLNSTTARHITFNGVTDTLHGWSKRTGCTAATIQARLGRLGWSTERALTTPTQRY